MNINYSQEREASGNLTSQTVEVSPEIKTPSELQQRVTEGLFGNGIVAHFDIRRGELSENLDIKYEFEDKNKPSSRIIDYTNILLMKNSSNAPISGIQFRLHYDESGILNAAIIDKGYRDGWYEGRGLMKLGFSILAETLKNFGAQYVVGYIDDNEGAVNSRSHAPKLFSVGETYETQTSIEKRPYEDPRYRASKSLATVLVTNLA